MRTKAIFIESPIYLRSFPFNKERTPKPISIIANAYTIQIGKISQSANTNKIILSKNRVIDPLFNKFISPSPIFLVYIMTNVYHI